MVSAWVIVVLPARLITGKIKEMLIPAAAAAGERTPNTADEK